MFSTRMSYIQQNLSLQKHLRSPSGVLVVFVLVGQSSFILLLCILFFVSFVRFSGSGVRHGIGIKLKIRFSSYESHYCFGIFLHSIICILNQQLISIFSLVFYTKLHSFYFKTSRSVQKNAYSILFFLVQSHSYETFF